MSDNAQARAREVLAEHGVVEGFRPGDSSNSLVVVVSSSVLAAFVQYGNERAAQEREACAAMVKADPIAAGHVRHRIATAILARGQS